MKPMEVGFIAWMLIIHWLTFWYWLRPAKPNQSVLTQTMQNLWQATLACLFFVSYFILGCWLSVLEWKGDL